MKINSGRSSSRRRTFKQIAFYCYTVFAVTLTPIQLDCFSFASLAFVPVLFIVSLLHFTLFEKFSRFISTIHINITNHALAQQTMKIIIVSNFPFTYFYFPFVFMNACMKIERHCLESRENHFSHTFTFPCFPNVIYFYAFSYYTMFHFPYIFYIFI